MSIQRSIRLSLAGAIALAVFGVAAVAAAQAPARQATQQTQPTTPAQPQAATQQGASGQFYQGTETSATYPLPDSHGGTLTVNAGMPAQVQSYGPPPSFKSLDTNHNGCISETEAQAYPPLDSDFLYASHQGKCVNPAQYKKWVQDLH